jgi:transposase
MKQFNYNGKPVYVGIDVHKKTYSCVAVYEGVVVRRDTMDAKQTILVHYLKNSFPGATIHSAYEAGFSGFHLHRYLISQGIENIVVHPGSIEVAARNRVKTDKRDALKIAMQLGAGRLKGIFVPTEQREEQRTLSRLRSNIIKLQHQVGQQFKALLFTKGMIAGEDDTRLCKKWLLQKLKEVQLAGFSEDFNYSINYYAEQWLDFSERLKKIESRLEIQANKDKTLETLYQSAPGIGATHSRQLANELVDMTQFKNEKHFFSYTGLTPSEHSSGEHIRQGHISRQGKPILRKIFIAAAWKAIKKDPSLEKIFNRISRKRGKKRAIVGVARRLAGRIRSCVLTGELYEIKLTEEACSKKVA